jgi:hypothetical protein
MCWNRQLQIKPEPYTKYYGNGISETLNDFNLLCPLFSSRKQSRKLERQDRFAQVWPLQLQWGGMALPASGTQLHWSNRVDVAAGLIDSTALVE